MSTHKGQAALEYLITYGWAIMTVMILIGGLYYFGVFNPKEYLPPSCEFGLDIKCEDYEIRKDATTETVSVILRNTAEQDFIISRVECELSGHGEHALTGDVSFPINSIKQFDCVHPHTQNGSIIIVDDKWQSKVTITLRPEGGFTRTVTGDVFSQVKS